MMIRLSATGPAGLLPVTSFRASPLGDADAPVPYLRVAIPAGETLEVPKGHAFDVFDGRGWSRYHARSGTEIGGPAIVSAPEPDAATSARIRGRRLACLAGLALVCALEIAILGSELPASDGARGAIVRGLAEAAFGAGWALLVVAAGWLPSGPARKLAASERRVEILLPAEIRNRIGEIADRHAGS